MLGEIPGVGPGHTVYRHLGKVVERIDAVVRRVVFRGAVSDLDKQTAWTRDQQGQRVMGRDQMRPDAKIQEAQALFEIVFPNRSVPLEQRFPTPYVVDQDIEPT